MYFAPLQTEMSIPRKKGTAKNAKKESLEEGRKICANILMVTETSSSLLRSSAANRGLFGKIKLLWIISHRFADALA